MIRAAVGFVAGVAAAALVDYMARQILAHAELASLRELDGRHHPALRSE